MSNLEVEFRNRSFFWGFNGTVLMKKEKCSYFAGCGFAIGTPGRKTINISFWGGGEGSLINPD